MEYDIVEYNKLYYNFLQRTEDFLDLCIEYNVAILHTLFDKGYSFYILKNKQSIIQKIFIIDGFIDDILKSSNTFKIMDENEQDLQTDLSINKNCSYILLNNFEQYIEWFSKLNKQVELLGKVERKS